MRATRFIAITIVALATLTCSGNGVQDSEAVMIDPSPVAVAEASPTSALHPKAVELAKLHEEKRCREFVDAFPADFEAFTQLYRYDTEQETLFPKYEQHFEFFVDCPEVGDREKITRLIEISADSKFDEDVPSGQLGEIVYDLVLRNPATARELLDGVPDTKAASFWYFLYDRPHPEHKQKVQQVNALIESLGKNTRQAKILSEQHRKLVQDWKRH